MKKFGCHVLNFLKENPRNISSYEEIFTLHGNATPPPVEDPELPAFSPFEGGMNFCVEHATFFPVKPLSYFCPVACGCRSGDPHCPDSCPVRTAAEALCPDYQRRANIPKYTCPMVQSYTGLTG